jgi:anion transporter
LGQAAARTGLAARLGYIIMQRMGNSYSRLLFGLIMLALLLQFLVPSPNAQISILASVAIGFVSAFDVGPRSNVAKGLFLALTYASYLFSRMFLAGGPAILTRGIIEGQTGAQILWSQWALAFLPLTLLTLVACWLIIYWLYPPETPAITGGPQYLQDTLQAMGPWSWQERKTLGWMVIAIALWGTDFLHHTHPALIGIGIGLILTLPKVGVLDKAAVKSVDFLLIVFLGGAISLGNVLVETQVLASATQALVDWINPLLRSPLSAAISLYWGGFLYHIPVANANAMVSTALPILLSVAEAHQYNPVAVGLLWLFASAGTLFIYQASSFVLGYSYGYFDARDLLKVGALLSVIEGLFIMVLVPLYWPLIGLSWRSTPQVAALPVTAPLASGVYVPNPTSIGTPWASGAHLRVTWAQVERQPGQFDWRSLEQHPAFVEAVRANKKVGFQVDIQGSTRKPALPAWVQVPQIGVAVGGTTKIWPAVWSPEFQTAFARFIKALAQRYDGDSRLAYVVMTEGTSIPYTVNPTQWDTAGYRATGYSVAYQQLYETYLQAFAHTPLVAAISWFGQESKERLEGGAEAQALRALLDFAGQHGLHVLVPEIYTRRAVRRIYVRDQILLPALRQYANRSRLLVKINPAEARGTPWGPQILQMAQALWPGMPVEVVIPTQ